MLLLQVSFNGYLTFIRNCGHYPRRYPIRGRPLIAPYWALMCIQDDENVWYRETTSQADRDRAQREIRSAFREDSGFTPHMVFIATWENITLNDRDLNKVCIYIAAIGLKSLKR